MDQQSFKLDSRLDTFILKCSQFAFSSFPFLSGDCINSSPAGKRRIAAEKQLSQLADEANNPYTADAALIDGAAEGKSDQIKSPVAFVALVAAAICSVFVIAFVTIFTVLQVSLWTT